MGSSATIQPSVFGQECFEQHFVTFDVSSYALYAP